MDLKIGDTVKVELVVSGIGSIIGEPTFTTTAGYVTDECTYCLLQSRIIEHTPKSPEIKVGFKFGTKDGDAVWEVVYTEEDFAVGLSRTKLLAPYTFSLESIKGWITKNIYVEIT